jgi:preprotein translocase subunit SecY
MAKTMNPGKADGLAELKTRLVFVLLAVIVYRMGTHIPIPGIDPAQLSALFNQNQGTFLGLFNMFSGGAMERMSIFALGIVPYITASIIVQLLTATTPALEQLKKEGESGRRKLSQYTRYGALFFATVQAVAISTGLLAGMAFTPNFSFYFTAIVSLVTGSMFLMWLGEQITERGVGNGISLIIFVGIVASLPTAIGSSLEQVAEGQIQPLALLVVAVLGAAVVAAVVFVERAQRRITVNYAPRQQGRKMMQGQSSHLPLKVNMAGVIPAIFASSFLLFPASVGQWFGQNEGFEWLADVALYLGAGQPLNLLLFTILIVAFCFWYTSLVFNPKEIAENLKRSGAFIPGIRPGENTANYVDSVMTRLTLFGAAYITLICLLPQFLQIGAGVPFQLGGTSLLIVVVVCMDFMAQVQSHLMSHQYESLMKKSNIGSFRR